MNQRSIKFSNVMIDLETLGQAPGCAILSIGAVAFDPRSGILDEGFYCVINRASCSAAGLYENIATLKWWEEQSEAARQVLVEAENTEVGLAEALDELTKYLGEFGLDYVRIWGNGADFDNALLSVAYNAVGKDVPWKFRNNRCYRTLKSLNPGPKLKRQGTYHNALDDAKTQAAHACTILR